MSRSGTYKYNKETGEVEKVSDRLPNVARAFDCFVPSGGYYSEHLGGFIRSKAQKREVMRKKGLRESGLRGRLDKREL